MTHTKVFATTAEVEELKTLANEAKNARAFGLFSAQVLSGKDFASMARRRLYERCHAMARGYGLPEIDGYYGLTEDGEFVKY